MPSDLQWSLKLRTLLLAYPLANFSASSILFVRLILQQQYCSRKINWITYSCTWYILRLSLVVLNIKQLLLSQTKGACWSLLVKLWPSSFGCETLYCFPLLYPVNSHSIRKDVSWPFYNTMLWAKSLIFFLTDRQDGFIYRIRFLSI